MNRTAVIIVSVLLTLMLISAGVGYYVIRNFADRAALLDQPPTHGTQFLFELDSAAVAGNTNVMAQFREAARKRFLAVGARIHFAVVTDHKVRITAPDLNPADIAFARTIFAQPGSLEFRLVHQDSEQLVESGTVPSGFELLTREDKQPNGQTRTEKFLIARHPEGGLTGSFVEQAAVMRNQMGRPEIAFKLKPEATPIFANITRQNIGRQLAIVLDGKLITAPRINSAIEGGSGTISGSYEPSEAAALAAALEAPLPVKVTLLESGLY